MHVLQWIGIKSDDVDFAVGSIEQILNENITNNWYDWFVVGGGRWNSSEDQYTNSTSMVIDNVDEIKKRIDMCIEGRVREFNHYRQSFSENVVSLDEKLDSYTGNTDYSFDLYTLGKMIDMLQGNWDMNSYFFDAENLTTNPKYMLDNIASGDVNWYLVPVDFHF